MHKVHAFHCIIAMHFQSVVSGHLKIDLSLSRRIVDQALMNNILKPQCCIEFVSSIVTHMDHIKINQM